VLTIHAAAVIPHPSEHPAGCSRRWPFRCTRITLSQLASLALGKRSSSSRNAGIVDEDIGAAKNS